MMKHDKAYSGAAQRAVWNTETRTQLSPTASHTLQSWALTHPHDHTKHTRALSFEHLDRHAPNSCSPLASSLSHRASPQLPATCTIVVACRPTRAALRPRHHHRHLCRHHYLHRCSRRRCYPCRRTGRHRAPRKPPRRLRRRRPTPLAPSPLSRRPHPAQRVLRR